MRDEREHKLESTIGQQTKLIDFLQVNLWISRYRIEQKNLSLNVGSTLIRVEPKLRTPS